MLKLAAHASITFALGDTPCELSALLAELSGQRFRRVNRYMELALLGALRCTGQLGAPPPADTALYLVSDVGMLDETAQLVARMQAGRNGPKPYEFMNLSGTMAAYQVAQHLGLGGPQLRLHGHYQSLESGLDLLGLQGPRQQRALLGLVEEGSWPLQQHRARLGLDDVTLSECSHWFYFDADADAPLARLHPLGCIARPGQVIEALSPWPGLSLTAFTQGRVDVDLARQAAGTALQVEDLPETGRVHSSGCVAAALLHRLEADAPRTPLACLNQADGGSYWLTVIEPGAA